MWIRTIMYYDVYLLLVCTICQYLFHGSNEITQMDSTFLLLNYLDNITQLLEMKNYDTMNSRKRVEIVWNTVQDAAVFLFMVMMRLVLFFKVNEFVLQEKQVDMKKAMPKIKNHNGTIKIC